MKKFTKNDDEYDDEKKERLLEDAEEFYTSRIKEIEKSNFIAYNFESETALVYTNYADAKNYVELAGGQVLVIDKEKIYTYKTKNENEYSDYLRKEIAKENLSRANFYGI